VRLFAAALLVLGLAGCAPEPAASTVELEGRITAVMASAGGKSYALDVPDEGLLPLDLQGETPPLNARGVVVEVPDGLELPSDVSGRFDALSAWVAESGEDLVVTAILN